LVLFKELNSKQKKAINKYNYKNTEVLLNVLHKPALLSQFFKKLLQSPALCSEYSSGSILFTSSSEEDLYITIQKDILRGGEGIKPKADQPGRGGEGIKPRSPLATEIAE
jgi:hypothetical protein